MRKTIINNAFLIFLFLILSIPNVKAQENGFELKVQYMESDDLTWGVYVKPVFDFEETIEGLIASGQITVLVKHGDADKIINKVNHSGTWRNFELQQSPIEAPNIDYLSFGLIDGGTHSFKNGQELLLFTFQSETCLDTLGIIDNKTDPFLNLPNSLRSNPGNDFEIFSTNNLKFIGGMLRTYSPFAYSCHDCDEDGIVDALEDTNGDGIFTSGIDASNLCNNDNNELDTPPALTTQNACITVNDVAFTSPSGCGKVDGSITVDAFHESGNGVQYSIDGGRVWHDSPTIGNLEAGVTYNLELRDNIGLCFVTYGEIILENSNCNQDPCVNTPFTIANYPDQMICTGGSILLELTGGTSYEWAPATGLSATNIANPIANPTSTTTYTVTVTNTTGCTATDEIIVNVVSNPTANAGEDQSICANASVLLAATEGGGNAYSWTPSTGLDNTAIPNPTANPNTTTNYTLLITDANGCTATDDLTINVENTPTISAEALSTTCSDEPTQLQASGGTSYSWSPTEGLDDPTSANPIATPTTNTIYTVVATGENACTASMEVSVAAEAANTFMKTYGSSDDDMANAGIVSMDGNYVVAGYTTITGKDKEAYISKISPTGSQIWARTIGGTEEDVLNAITQLPNGDYAVIGTTKSFGAGDADILLSRIDETGNIIWSKTFGGANIDNGNYLIRTPDAILFGGVTESHGTGQRDVFIAKMDFDGNILWTKTIGDTGNDWLGSFGIDINPDGNYILTGSWSSNEGLPAHNGFLIALDPNGDILFSRLYGGNDNEGFATCIEDDRTAFLVGNSWSWNGENLAVWVTEIDRLGAITNAKTYGIPNKNIRPGNPILMENSSLVIPAYEAIDETTGNSFLMKLSATGEVMWAKSYGGEGLDRIVEVQEIATGFVLFGYSDSYGQGGKDILIIKTDKNGNVATCSEEANIIGQTVATEFADPTTTVLDQTIDAPATLNSTPLTLQEAVQCVPTTDIVAIDLGIDTLICLDESIQLNRNPSGDYSYNWSPIEGLDTPTVASPTASPTTTTTYCVTITNADGCTATDCLVVEVDEFCEEDEFGEGGAGASTGNTINPCAIGELADGLVAKYSFHNGSTNDEVGNVNGLMNNTLLTTDRFGNPNHAIDFQSNESYIDFGDNFDLFSGADSRFSFSFWMQNVESSNQLIISKYGNSTCSPREDQREFFIRINQDNLIEFLYYGNVRGGHYRSVEGNTVINDSCWHHVVINYNGSLNSNDGLDRVEIYVDNIKNTVSFSLPAMGTLGDIQTSLSHLGMGMSLNSSGQPCSHQFTGKLDDVSIYSRNLCSQEVNLLYNELNSLAGTNNGAFAEFQPENCGITPCPTSPAIVGCPDKFMCPDGQAQLVVNGGIRWEWSPSTGLDDPTSSIPLATPTETTTYTVTGWDANGCSATDEVVVNVITTGSCAGTLPTCQDATLLADEKLCIDKNANFAEVCIPYPLEGLNVSYSIELVNTTPIFIHGCNFGEVWAYQYNFLPAAGQGGDYRVKGWTVNNTIQTESISSMQELANFMQNVDPAGNWIIDPSRFSIIGGATTATYGDLIITQPSSAIETVLRINQTQTPNGTLVEVDMTGIDREVLTLTDLTTGCVDQLIIERPTVCEDCATDCIQTPTTTTMTLRPGPEDGQDSYVQSRAGNEAVDNLSNYGDLIGMAYVHWTNSAQGFGEGSFRSFIHFPEINNIPATANIKSAKLSLFNLPASNPLFSLGNSHYTGSPYGENADNKGWVKRVLSPWEEMTINWGNQPATTDINQAEISGTTTRFDEIITDIDVTQLVQDMLDSNEINGFSLQLQKESIYRSVFFATSEYEDESLRPMLVIEYE